MTPGPDFLELTPPSLWALIFSAALAAIGFYDVLYVISASWRRWRQERRFAELQAKVAQEARSQAQTRMARVTDRKDPPIP